MRVTTVTTTRAMDQSTTQTMNKAMAKSMMIPMTRPGKEVHNLQNVLVFQSLDNRRQTGRQLRRFVRLQQVRN